MPTSSTYSFLDAQISLNDPATGASFSLAPNDGNGDGGVTVTMAEAKNTMTTGADGSVMHSLHAAKAGHMTVQVLKTAPLNSFLNALYRAQENTSFLWGKMVITINDFARGDYVTCNAVAFAKQPDLAYAKEGGVVTWLFDAGFVDQILGVGVPDVNVA